jgi:hypothetical protein
MDEIWYGVGAYGIVLKDGPRKFKKRSKTNQKLSCLLPKREEIDKTRS